MTGAGALARVLADDTAGTASTTSDGSTLAVVLMGLGGILLGGAWSLRQQERSWVAVAVFAVLGLGLVAAGVLYLF